MSTWERLTRTKIYQTLYEKEKDKSHYDQEVISLLNCVSAIVKDTDILLSRIHDNFPEYTLHDTTHSVKIVELMDKIIPDKTLKSLNGLELSILILSAYLHDIGMIKSREETDRILKSKDFIEFYDDNIDISKSIEEAIKISDNRTAVELEDALITEFIRKKHGERTYKYITDIYRNNPLLNYYGVNFAEDLALICESHTLDTFDLAKKEGDKLIEAFRRDKVIYKEEINIQYLAICLRLADIMDFDRERTPKILFKYISPKSKISLNEWMKHISITGWRINKNEIRYEAECIHPVYQNVLYKFIDQIDAELERCNILVKDNKEEITRKYKLDLPVKVNRDYIRSKGFYYGPFKFSLDYDRIIALLMGEQLYGDKNIAIRELLQNSIDACRHRQAFEKMNGEEGYRSQISFKYENKDKYDVVEVEDNGIGMDKYILENYFMKIGVSYYRSKDFGKERIEYKKKGFDFDPISRFGIGILSCFMIADRIVVETYRAKSLLTGNNQALEIEIDGPSQFFVIRKGKRNTFGTKINLFLKKDQKIDLAKIVREYAKHVEFPIIVKGEQSSKPIELIDEGFKIEPIKSGLKVELEKKISVIEIDLSKNKKYNGIKGKLNLYFLKDEMGNICLERDDIQISGNNFVRRMDEKTLLELISQFNPYAEKGDFMEYLSHRKIQISEMSFHDILRMLEDVYFYRRRNFAPDLFEGYLNKFYEHYIKIASFYLGIFSCDGILVGLPWPYLNLDLPHGFDINVIGDDKPNLRVARDTVVNDETFILLVNKIKIIIADMIYELLLNDRVSNIPEKRYKFVTKLCLRDNNLFIFKELLNYEIFKKNVQLIKVQKKDKLIFSSLNDIINDFSGTIFLSDYNNGAELPKFLKKEAWINNSEEFIIDLITNSAELVFFSNEKRSCCYFKIFLQSIDDIRFDKEPFKFAGYLGKYRKNLFCKNRLNALNSNHTISKIYFRLKEINEPSNKEIITIFETLFKLIIDSWSISEEKLREIDNIIKEIKLRVSLLDYIDNKKVDEIIISKEYFNFW